MQDSSALSSADRDSRWPLRMSLALQLSRPKVLCLASWPRILAPWHYATHAPPQTWPKEPPARDTAVNAADGGSTVPSHYRRPQCLRLWPDPRRHQGQLDRGQHCRQDHGLLREHHRHPQRSRHRHLPCGQGMSHSCPTLPGRARTVC